MSESDDDLPPPPVAAPKKSIPAKLPSSSDDDLPPPPKPVAAAVASKARNDSDDDLPPPPPKPAVNLDDSDDDLPNPPAATDKKAPMSVAPTAAAERKDADGAADGHGGMLRTRSRHVNVEALKKERKGKPAVRNVNDVFLEGFLFKQSPNWPHPSQKRWCTLKGRTLNYYEAQGHTVPAGTLDLKGADLVDVSKTAKMPNSFGITGTSGQLKSRTYVFSALSREDYTKWTETISLAVAEPKVSELHWFEKMAQAVF